MNCAATTTESVAPAESFRDYFANRRALSNDPCNSCFADLVLAASRIVCAVDQPWTFGTMTRWRARNTTYDASAIDGFAKLASCGRMSFTQPAYCQPGSKLWSGVTLKIKVTN